MNTSNVIRVSELNAAPALAVSIKVRVSRAWHTFTRYLFAQSVVGNPLHEAWSADGEPLERMSPEDMAKSSTSRHLVIPHSRGR